MYRRVSTFLFPDPALWICLVILAVVTFVWSKYLNFTIEYGEANVVFYIAAGFLGLGVVYQKRSPSLAIFAFSFSFLIFLSMVLRPMSYLAIAQQYPIIDNQLAQFDKMIGFDWLGHVSWVNSHPFLYELLLGAYKSISYQIFFVFAVLYLTLNLERLREYIVLFFAMGAVSTVLVTFFPAVGASYFYHPSPEMFSNMFQSPGDYSREHFMALHNGTKMGILFTDSIGLITFPSFHTQAVFLFIWAVRRTVMFWPIFILNMFMLLSTVAVGGHYILDIVAGAAVAIILAYAYGVWVRRYQVSFKAPRMKDIADATTFKAQLPIWGMLKNINAK